MRPLRSLDASDIEGTRPGWRPHALELRTKDTGLDVSDITKRTPSFSARHQQLTGGLSSSGGAANSYMQSSRTLCSKTLQEHSLVQAGTTNGLHGSPPAVPHVLLQSLSDVGIRKDSEWRAARAAVQRQAAEEQRAAWASAASALAPRSVHGLAALMRGFKVADRGGSGRLSSREFVGVLAHSELGLRKEELAQLATGGGQQHMGNMWAPVG